MKMYKIGISIKVFLLCCDGEVAGEVTGEANVDQLNYWLARFVVKVRRIDQRPYPLPICIEEFESDC